MCRIPLKYNVSNQIVANVIVFLLSTSQMRAHLLYTMQLSVAMPWLIVEAEREKSDWPRLGGGGGIVTNAIQTSLVQLIDRLP